MLRAKAPHASWVAGIEHHPTGHKILTEHTDRVGFLTQEFDGKPLTESSNGYVLRGHALKGYAYGRTVRRQARSPCSQPPTLVNRYLASTNFVIAFPGTRSQYLRVVWRHFCDPLREAKRVS